MELIHLISRVFFFWPGLYHEGTWDFFFDQTIYVHLSSISFFCDTKQILGSLINKSNLCLFLLEESQFPQVKGSLTIYLYYIQYLYYNAMAVFFGRRQMVLNSVPITETSKKWAHKFSHFTLYLLSAKPTCYKYLQSDKKKDTAIFEQAQSNPTMYDFHDSTDTLKF